MARQPRDTKDSEFVRRATRLGLEQMKRELDVILREELAEAQHIAISEMHSQIITLLEDYQ